MLEFSLQTFCYWPSSNEAGPITACLRRKLKQRKNKYEKKCQRNRFEKFVIDCQSQEIFVSINIAAELKSNHELFSTKENHKFKRQ